MFGMFKRSASKPKETTQVPATSFGIAAIEIDAVNALHCPPYMSAITLLATNIAKLGKHVMKKGERKQQHDLEQLLREPNPYIDGYTMFLQAETQRLNNGNAYIHITREQGGKPKALMLIDQGNVSQELRPNGFVYRVSTGSGTKIIYPRDMIHVRSPQLDSEMRGIGYYAVLKEQLKLWLSAQKHQTNYFELGAHPISMLQTAEILAPEAKARVREEWERLNGNNNKHRVAVLDGKFDYKHMGTNFNELELNGMYGELTKQIASAFNIAPYLLGHEGSKNTYSNIESQNMQFLQNSLMPGVIAWEYQLKKLCNDGEEIRFNIESLLRADSKSRAERLAILVDKKILTIDEAREYESLPPLQVLQVEEVDNEQQQQEGETGNDDKEAV